MSHDIQPTINVYTLGKFGFCHRAALLAHESDQGESDDQEAKPPRLDFLPIFEKEELRECLLEATRQLTHSGLGITLCALCLGVLAWLGWYTLLFFLSPILLIIGRKTYLHFQEGREIHRRLKQIESAKSATLGNPKAGVRRIEWWGLLKNEQYSSAAPQASYHSRSENLTGKPARILSYQDQRIPVILYHGELENPKPYHLVRLHAYAHLIRKNLSGVAVPWGIILDPHSMKGLAVPIEQETLADTLKKITALRVGIQEAENGTNPTAAAPELCAKCPHGRPKLYRLFGVTVSGNGEKLPIHAAREGQSRLYHSECGDRFEWVPPHERALRLRLKSD